VEAAKAAQAESEATRAQSEQKEEEAKDTQYIHFLDAKTAQKVNAAKSEATQAESETTTEKTKAAQQSTHYTYFTAFLACAFLLLATVAQTTPRGRAFKERASERFSGLIGRRNEKKQPLLDSNSRLVGA